MSQKGSTLGELTPGVNHQKCFRHHRFRGNPGQTPDLLQRLYFQLAWMIMLEDLKEVTGHFLSHARRIQKLWTKQSKETC